MQTLISQPENFQRDFHGESHITRTYYATPFIFRFYDPPLRSLPISLNARYTVFYGRSPRHRGDTVRQGRAPASRSGCATLRSIAKDCIEKIDGYIR